jgi:hypothetical protein
MININKKKVMDKWSPILEKMNIQDPTRREWMSEYAEYHQIHENVGYVNNGLLNGMGPVTTPGNPGTPGVPSVGGSGDLGQALLPVAMKVAGQTIGLDLVAVKPTPGPVIDLMYVDYKYDDVNTDEANPVVFKVSANENAAFAAEIRALFSAAGVRETQGGLTKRMFFNLPANTSPVRAAGARVDVVTVPTASDSKEGVVEFLGFSRIDGLPMFAAYRQPNQIGAMGTWSFKADKNTFAEMETVVAAFSLANGTSGVHIDASFAIGDLTGVSISLVSALEDHIPGFVANGNKHAMTRQEDEAFYPGIIAPNVTTKRVQVGTIEVSSALKRTEIEDIKAQTGIDIVQKLEAVLVNELSQTISKEIVAKVFAMGDLNRQSAPGYSSGTTIFDFNVTNHLTAYSVAAGSGETSQSLQRKLITKVKNASGFISTEGRIGPATYIVTNHTLAAVLTEGSNYSLNPVDASVNGSGQLYPMGKVAGMTVYVDPFMKYDDKRILLGRKNNPDQPGIIFVPYLMAQSISLISESTWAPRMLLRSRYAVTEVGFFPHKQYMTIVVTDPSHLLN